MRGQEMSLALWPSRVKVTRRLLCGWQQCMAAVRLLAALAAPHQHPLLLHPVLLAALHQAGSAAPPQQQHSLGPSNSSSRTAAIHLRSAQACLRPQTTPSLHMGQPAVVVLLPLLLQGTNNSSSSRRQRHQRMCRMVGLPLHPLQQQQQVQQQV